MNEEIRKIRNQPDFAQKYVNSKQAYIGSFRQALLIYIEWNSCHGDNFSSNQLGHKAHVATFLSDMKLLKIQIVNFFVIQIGSYVFVVKLSPLIFILPVLTSKATQNF